MKTLLRQDGSEVVLSDAEAKQWIKRGLATTPTVVEPAKPEPLSGKKTAEKSTVKGAAK